MSERTVSFVEALVERFPSLRIALDEHIQDNFGELLPHVFFGDVTRHVLTLLLESGGPNRFVSKRELQQILERLEEVYATGDEELQELISVSFLESLPRPGEHGSEIREMVGPNLARQLRVIG